MKLRERCNPIAHCVAMVMRISGYQMLVKRDGGARVVIDVQPLYPILAVSISVHERRETQRVSCFRIVVHAYAGTYHHDIARVEARQNRHPIEL